MDPNHFIAPIAKNTVYPVVELLGTVFSCGEIKGRLTDTFPSWAEYQIYGVYKIDNEQESIVRQGHFAYPMTDYKAVPKPDSVQDLGLVGPKIIDREIYYPGIANWISHFAPSTAIEPDKCVYGHLSDSAGTLSYSKPNLISEPDDLGAKLYPMVVAYTELMKQRKIAMSAYSHVEKLAASYGLL